MFIQQIFIQNPKLCPQEKKMCLVYENLMGSLLDSLSHVGILIMYLSVT